MYAAIITRLPYQLKYDPQIVLGFTSQVAPRGLICLSIPIHVESPNNGGRLISQLEDLGLTLVAKIVWFRDRHIVTTKSKRVTNTWEPLAIFSRSNNYVINRDAVTKIKKGYENRDGAFEEEEYITCCGDYWPIRNDRRDRRFLPSTLVLNCGQLADLHPNSLVFDPYGNPGVRDACQAFGWGYEDGGLPSSARLAKKSQEKIHYVHADLSRYAGQSPQDNSSDS